MEARRPVADQEKREPMSPKKYAERVLLLSDTHGHLHPAIRELAASVDHIVHAGDIGDLDILRKLATGGANLLAIRGNNDSGPRYPSDDRKTLGELAEHAHLELPGGILVTEHGHRSNPAKRRHAILRARYPHARLVVYGHSHRQCIDSSGNPMIANPGAAGRSRTFGGSGCILLAASARTWELQALQFPLGDWKS
jgi:putative phosphoesterase